MTRIISLPVRTVTREASAAARRDGRVILLDDAARARAAAKSKPPRYPVAGPDNLTAA
jgi:hypothetical protein